MIVQLYKIDEIMPAELRVTDNSGNISSDVKLLLLHDRLLMKKRSRDTKQLGNGATVIPLFTTINPAPNNADDIELLARFAQGDNEAFDIIVRRHSTKFFRLAYRFTSSRSEAEDIVQDAFLKLWENPGSWKANKNTAFTTWFYRVVVNLCLDRAKKKRPVTLIDDSWVEDDRQSQVEDMLSSEKERLLATQINLLPERQRTALNLCFYEGLSNQDAADIMGLHLKALQALLMRAKTTLRERLQFMIGE